MMKKFHRITGFFFFTLLLVTCHSSQRVTKTNHAYIYYEDPTIIHPSYQVFHISEDVSSLYLQVNSTEILYSRNNPRKEFLSQLIFQVKVYELQNSNKLVVSDTVFLMDKGGSDRSKFLQGKIDLNLPSGVDYFAEVTLDDEYRMQFVQDLVLIRKKDELTAQHFKVTNTKGEIQFQDAVQVGSRLKIWVSPMIGKGPVEMRYYKEPIKLPVPPFGVPEEKVSRPQSDSGKIFKLEGGSSFEIYFDKRGVYQFNKANMYGNGLTLLVLGQNYPAILSVSSMMRPLRYISTRQEYASIKESGDKKKEIDAFWYNIAGNSEKARETIRTYYSRVDLSNRFFTSDREGWMTDRGLVYIIYGTPNTVTKNIHGENWIYNEKVNMMSVEFNFSKVLNPFSDNDYVLNRAGGYKSSWYRAIDNWRQGRIF